ncbi:MAG: FecR domain-containing protein [Kiritimatiellae bacterium]|nr:FecR domain-containing protein [Kiritimatiellia bacterium]
MNMRRLHHRILILVLAFSLAVAAVPAADPIGQVIAIQGQATATGPDGDARPLAEKAPVFFKDTIRTEKRSKLQLMLTDDSILSQGPASEMVLDEYSYAPARRKDNACKMSFVNGVFRTVTGKITDLNPEAFQVKTRRAVIGIRGCDLAFRVEEAKDDVYVLRLPRRKRIRVEQTLRDETLGAVMDIAQAGIAVTIQEGMAPQKRRFSASEARTIMQGATPGAPSEEGGGGGGGGQSSLPGQTPDAALLLGETGAPAQESVNEVIQQVSDLTGQDLLGTYVPTLSATPDGIDWANIDLPPLPDLPAEPPPTPPPPGTLPPPPVALGIGSHWYWSIWADDTMDIAGSLIARSDFEELVESARQFDLNGNGPAGALVWQGGTTTRLDGNCALHVQVGPGNNAWSGQFQMQNGGDSLNFDAAGPILSDGRLTGSPGNYSLRIGEAVFDANSLTRRQIEGYLAGPGHGETPITGAAGKCEFEHGGAARVNAVFGADVN